MKSKNYFAFWPPAIIVNDAALAIVSWIRIITQPSRVLPRAKFRNAILMSLGRCWTN